MATERRYTDEEVQAILERALQRDQAQGLTHGDLLEVATEVGISAEALESAAEDIGEIRARQLAHERVLTRRRQAFFSHLRAFIAVNLFLVILNLLTSPDVLWFVYPLLGWGLGLFFSAQAGLSKQVSERQLTRELRRGPPRLQGAGLHRPAPPSAAPQRSAQGEAPAPPAPAGPEAPEAEADSELARKRQNRP